MYKNINLSAVIALVSTLFTSTNTFSMEKIEISITYVGDTNNSAYLGTLQGLTEANLQGQFLNQNYSINTIASNKVSQSDFSDQIAIIVAADKNTFKKIVNNNPTTPVFNINLDDDEMRLECLPNALHIFPSHKMKADAIDQWLKKKPESNAIALAWHSDFVKFAARDLNKRFLKNHNTKMDDFAWAGWAAVKMLSDTVARENITEPGKLLNYLKTDLRFDGQKGIEMNFRETGQLRQLILLVEDEKIVAEAPVRGVAKPPTVDSLGILSCPK